MSARILVVDDQPANVRLLEARLQAEYFDVCTAENGQQALEVARLEQPDVILLDVMMPGMDGYEVCRRLKADAATRHIPVVMVTALDQSEDRIKGLEAGADDFLTKPVDEVSLFARVRSLLRLKAVLDELRYREDSAALAGAPSEHVDELGDDHEVVIIAADDRVMPRYVAAMPEGASTRTFSDPGEGMKAINAETDLLIVDLTSPAFDGMRICARVRSDNETRQLPIVAVVNPEDVQTAVRSLDLGVNDVVYRPVDGGELNARARTQLRRKHYADRLRSSLDHSLELAVKDSLTGLHNRRYIESRLRQAIDSANSGGAPVSVMIADIDHFKRINDTWGHEAGDAVLKGFAQRIIDGLRALDLAARYGGEEFVIMMPGAGLAEAAIAADRLRARVESSAFEIPGADPVNVTVSIGLAQLTAGEDMDSLLRRADAALYEAKTDGRNRIQAATNAAA